ncbi:hypothetical protein [Modestobacter altitudinis]|uniref:hypothetical protein n=1 Tax=Modestobacter altitudinis TaxID=2213158 RepID=UPI00110D00E8|nr:hypothetical protein [Modestobacter altitudinis]
MTCTAIDQARPSRWRGLTVSTTAAAILIGSIAAGAPAMAASQTAEIGGTVQVGSTVTAIASGWTNANYEWLETLPDKSVNVVTDGDTDDKTFTIPAQLRLDDAQLSVRVSEKADTSVVPVESAKQTVAAGKIAASSPTISNITDAKNVTDPTSAAPKVGDTLKVASSVSKPATANAPTYEWYAGTSNVSIGSGSTYTLTGAEAGKTVYAMATTTAPGYNNDVSPSAATKTVANGTFTWTSLTLSNTNVGENLTATAVVTPTLTTPPAINYKFATGSTVLQDGPSKSYTLKDSDAGNSITVTATAAATGYTDASQTATVAKVGNGSFVVGAPLIDGTATVGQTLTASPNASDPSTLGFTYQWATVDATTGVSTNISGANGAKYTLVGADAGKKITVTIFGSKKGFNSASATAVAPTSVVAQGSLVSSAPAITGTAVVGKTLTATPGTTTPVQDSYTYQWYAGNAAITGATGSTFVPTADQVGKKLTVDVTAVKTGYASRTQPSAETLPVSASDMTSGVPTISGTAKLGETLTATAGKANVEGTIPSYQWSTVSTDGKTLVPIAHDANESTFKLTALEVGKSVAVTVTAIKAGYNDDTQTSKKTAVVLAGDLAADKIGAPAWATSPKVNGAAPAVNPDPSTATKEWDSGTTFTYAWALNGVTVQGQTGPSYSWTDGSASYSALKPSDAGKKLSVTVTGTNAAGYAGKVVLEKTVAFASFTNLDTPTISGAAGVGNTLRADAGDSYGEKLSYQWYRGTKAIDKATKSYYKVAKADMGQQLSVRVTHSATGYVTKTVGSAKTAAVATAFSSAKAAKIYGTTTVGSTLTAKVYSWSPKGATFGYQWERDGVAITGATGLSYQLVDEDVNSEITFTLTGKKHGYATTAVTSNPRTIAE